ncbi:hypothetical protein PINS_up003545 [Pythium insidiosum]|nr:hypothetical protein PINS_up003545 [Pythium insidiosum]
MTRRPPKSGVGCAGVACEHALAREPLHLYGYLWAKPDLIDDSCGSFSFVLPDTVLFKHQKPVRWFFTSKQERGKVGAHVVKVKRGGSSRG